MSIFGEMDWNKVPDDPFALPDNSYIAYLTDVKVGPTKSGDKVGMTIVYTIDSGEYAKREITEWKQIPEVKDPKNPTEEEARAASFVKARMLDLGVPAERISITTPDDLIGIRVVVTTRRKGQYTNVVRVQAVSEEFVGY